MTRAKIRYFCSTILDCPAVKVPGEPIYIRRYLGDDVHDIIADFKDLVNQEERRLWALGWGGVLARWKAVQKAAQKLQGKRYSIPCPKPWVMYVVQIKQNAGILISYYKARGLPLEAEFAVVKFPLEAEVIG